MTEETKKENQFKKLLDLKPLLTPKLGPKLKPIAKILYYILSAILCILLLGTLFSLSVVGFSGFLIEVLLIALDFVVVRMFAEYLYNS